MTRWLAVSMCLALAALPAVCTTTEIPEQLREVGIDQRLNEQIPANLAFRDSSGELVRLGDYFGRKPLVLALVYYECPMLCTLVLNGLVRALRAMPMDIGKDFEIITVSFNPSEGPELAAAKKQEYLSRYKRDGAANGWHFLTGEESQIHALTAAAGFRYRYDPETKQFSHASGIMILTPDGKLSRYQYGVEYSARDLRLALVEAAAGEIGTPVDQILLYCFHYDPITGKYGLVIMNVIRILGGATVFGLLGFVLLMLRRDRKTKPTSYATAAGVERET